VKGQTVRLIDVFVLGPFMLWAATQMRSDVARLTMATAGAATIVYNWRNYERQKLLETEKT
jgi:hypothetical protein